MVEHVPAEQVSGPVQVLPEQHGWPFPPHAVVQLPETHARLLPQTVPEQHA